MKQDFRVIEGGLVDETSSDPVTGAAPSARRLRVDLRRPLAVGEEDVAAWRALLTRMRAPDPVLADPDYLLTAAQHQAGGRDLVFALAWEADDGIGRLRGVIPLAMPHRLWGNGRVEVWTPPGTAIGPSIEPSAFSAVETALIDQLRVLNPRATVDLAPGGEPRSAFERAIAPLWPVPAIPARNLVGVRPAGSRPWAPQGGEGRGTERRGKEGPEIERIVEPHLIRDAVEEFLTFDAWASAAPIIGDPSEAAMVRVVTRLFARRRQAGVDFARRGGTLVGAALRLGAGPTAIVWRRVEGQPGVAQALRMRPA